LSRGPCLGRKKAKRNAKKKPEKGKDGEEERPTTSREKREAMKGREGMQEKGFGSECKQGGNVGTAKSRDLGFSENKVQMAFSSRQR